MKNKFLKHKKVVDFLLPEVSPVFKRRLNSRRSVQEKNGIKKAGWYLTKLEETLEDHNLEFYYRNQDFSGGCPVIIKIGISIDPLSTFNQCRLEAAKPHEVRNLFFDGAIHHLYFEAIGKKPYNFKIRKQARGLNKVIQEGVDELKYCLFLHLNKCQTDLEKIINERKNAKKRVAGRRNYALIERADRLYNQSVLLYKTYSLFDN